MRRIAEETGLSVDGLIGNTAVLKTLRPRDFADDHFGVPTVTDILAELDKPGRDPRPEFATATFKEGVEKISDLIPGMILEGTVTNVAAFGAFVDVGVHQDGLVHVSALAETFVSDPHYVVRSGQVVKVKVMDVDPERKRISLSMKLSDGPGAGAAKSASRNAKTSKDGRSSLGNSKRNTSQRRGPSQHSAGGAMAEALRRAGLK